MPNWSLPWEGGCRCDRVRFAMKMPPLMTAACHCRGCQKMSSSAFSLTIISLSDGFALTKGETVVGGLKGEQADHHFCAWCMTWMFTRPKQMPHIVNVRPTMLDDPKWFEPFMETYTKAKLPWARTGAIRSFEEFPEMSAYEGLMKEFAAKHA